MYKSRTIIPHMTSFWSWMKETRNAPKVNAGGLSNKKLCNILETKLKKLNANNYRILLINLTIL